MTHELSKQHAQEGCKKCCAYYLDKYLEFRLTDIERMRMEELISNGS